MLKTSFIAVVLAAASAALGQTSQPQQNPPPQPPPAQPQPPQQPGSQSTAGSQGQSSTAQPSSPGASSQQVVVNPPPSQQPSVPPPANPPPPSSTTVVNPPPTYAPGYGQEEVVVRREPRNPMATVATDAAYGALAGLLVGLGVSLVNQWDHWERDSMVGTGAGVLAGAAVGVAQAVGDSRDERRRIASDGLNRTDRDPLVAPRRGVSFAFAF